MFDTEARTSGKGLSSSSMALRSSSILRKRKGKGEERRRERDALYRGSPVLVVDHGVVGGRVLMAAGEIGRLWQMGRGVRGDERKHIVVGAFRVGLLDVVEGHPVCPCLPIARNQSWQSPERQSPDLPCPAISHQPSAIMQPSLSQLHLSQAAVWRPVPLENSPQPHLPPQAIAQHLVTDCSLCASLVVCLQHAATFHSSLAYNALRIEKNICYATFFLNGAWTPVAVDNTLPFNPADGSLMAMSVRAHPPVYWPCFIEKTVRYLPSLILSLTLSST